jgi:hypothetical protein
MVDVGNGFFVQKIKHQPITKSKTKNSPHQGMGESFK